MFVLCGIVFLYTIVSNAFLCIYLLNNCVTSIRSCNNFMSGPTEYDLISNGSSIVDINKLNENEKNPPTFEGVGWPVHDIHTFQGKLC